MNTEISCKNRLNLNKSIDDNNIQICLNDVEYISKNSVNNKKKVFIISSPIINNEINKELCADLLLEDRINLTNLDGEFLIIVLDEKFDSFYIINDRFASIPIFFTNINNKLFLSNLYINNLKFIKTNNLDINFNINTFFEFIHFHRLFGSKTYDHNTKYLNSASILSFKDGNISIKKYWEPNYQIENKPEKEYAEILADAIRSSISAKLSDGKKSALLLSGGMDSRVVLAALEKNIPCITLGDYKNKEFEISSNVANIKGCKHYFFKRGKSYYSDIIYDAVRLSNCMNVYYHAHFLELIKYDNIDILIHGHGFDYLFQGMYLPFSYRHIFGKETAFKNLVKLKDNNFIELFIKYGIFGTKSCSPFSIVKDSYKKDVYDSLYNSLESVKKEAEKHTDDLYKIWQFFIIHNLSRHYTNLNLISISKSYLQRVVAFYNDILNIHTRMPIRYQINAKVLKRTLTIMNNDLSKAKSANTGYRMNASDLSLTLFYKYSGFKKKMGISRKNNNQYISNSKFYTDKSWPNMNELVKHNEIIKNKVVNMKNSKYLNSLKILDMNKICSIIDSHVEGKSNNKDIIFSLLTIDEFFKQI